MDGKKIVIITGQHMTANPRVWKEANTLCKHGYAVTVLTTIYDRSKLEQDRKLLHPAIIYKPLVNLIRGEGELDDTIASRLKRKVFLFLKRTINYDSVHILLYNPAKQIKIALKETADLYVAHQETGLIIGCKLLQDKRNVAFDFEDWYSHDYLNKERPVALLITKEQFAISNASYVTCPSIAMAKGLATFYNTSSIPTSIYNSFPEANMSNKQVKKSNSLVWFSQVIGPGRGLEDVFIALSNISFELELHLLGKVDSGYKKYLTSIFPNHHRVVFHLPVPHIELTNFLSQFTVGLALENEYPESRNLTITNKILQYLQAGLKVIASDTEGQREVAEESNGAVKLIKCNQPASWHKVIEESLNVQQDHFSKEIHKRNFSWELQEKKLLQLVKQALN
jgi:glycosyltransferase involved in cell wall biosynthesis